MIQFQQVTKICGLCLSSQLSPAARAINRTSGPGRASSERWRPKNEPQIRRHTFDIADDMSDVSSLARISQSFWIQGASKTGSQIKIVFF